MSYPSEALNPAALTEAMESRDPSRVRDAIATLDQAWRRRQFAPLPFPDADILDAAFPAGAPKELVEQYLAVLEGYPDFEPTPSSSQVRRAMLEAVVRSGQVELAYNVALRARIDPFPAAAAEDLMDGLTSLDLSTEREHLVGAQLIDWLLDSQDMRAATVQKLRFWGMCGRYPSLVALAKARLTPEELEYLARDVD